MLSNEQKEFYAENGYVLVKGMFSKAEAATYREEAHALINRVYENETIDPTWDGAKQVTQKRTKLLHCHDVQFYSAAFSQLIMDERLTACAAGIIGTDNVQLHHTKMFIKPPENGSPFPMHQDAPFFPHENDSMIAAIVHLDDAPLQKGCVRVVPGTHKLGYLKTAADGHHLPIDQYPIDDATPCPAEAGDVIFFSYLTVHGSGVNTSDEDRTTVLIQMRDAADKPSKNVHASKGQGMMLRGINPITQFITEKDL